MTGRTLDRSRLARLMADETAAFERANPRSRALFERAKGSLLDGVPMNWMIRWAGPFPLFVDEATRRALHATSTATSTSTSASATPGAMAGHGPAPTIAAVERQLRRGDHPHAADRGRDRRRRRAPPAVRAPVLAVHAHGDRRQPVRDPARPPHHRPVEDPRPQPQLPRLGRRDVRLDRARRRRRRPARQPRRAGAAVRDHAGRRDQRHRRARARARPRRRRRRAHGAGADQRRDRAPGPRLPRGRARADPPARHAPDHRRDPHDLRRARRLHGRPRPRARHPHDRQDHRRRHPGRRLRVHRGAGRADRGEHPRGGRGRRAASAARWPGTRSRWRPSGRR